MRRGGPLREPRGLMKATRLTSPEQMEVAAQSPRRGQNRHACGCRRRQRPTIAKTSTFPRPVVRADFCAISSEPKLPFLGHASGVWLRVPPPLRCNLRLSLRQALGDKKTRQKARARHIMYDRHAENH